MQSSSDALNHCQLSFGATTAFGASHTALKVNTFLSILYMQFYDCNIWRTGMGDISNRAGSRIVSCRHVERGDPFQWPACCFPCSRAIQHLNRSDGYASSCEMGYLVELCGSTREINEINSGVEVFALVVLGSNSLKEICMPRIIGGRDGPGRTGRKFLDGPGWTGLGRWAGPPVRGCWCFLVCSTGARIGSRIYGGVAS